MGVPGTPCGGVDGDAPLDPVYRVAASLKGEVATALEAESWSGAAIVSHGPAGVPLRSPCAEDQLCVWATIVGLPGAANHRRITLAMRLSVACWPTIEVDGQSTIQFPDSAEQDKAAAWLYHWACVADAALVSWSKRITKSISGERTPITPSGGMAGWDWTGIVVPATSSMWALLAAEGAPCLPR